MCEVTLHQDRTEVKSFVWLPEISQTQTQLLAGSIPADIVSD